ncbi:MAG: NACHT domain-containing protein, partial [Acidobacteriota bacterium]
MKYPWKRFWCPRGAAISLADRGYLVDPRTDYGKAYNPDLVMLEEIQEIPCVILLGEPGLGKSQALVEAFEAGRGSSPVVLKDLRAYDTDNYLVKDIFRDSTLRDWLEGEGELQLLLDSLDEGLLHIRPIANLLSNELGKLPKHRVQSLKLRIACRTFDWPVSLERALRKLWGDQAVGVYELAPLLREDVVAAAKAEGICSDSFLAQIESTAAESLALKPVTLRLLLNVFGKSDQLAGNPTELYERGCRLLCEETNESRLDSGFKGSLSPEQRLLVAARIAAATIIGNHYAIWTAPDIGDVPDSDVTVRELTGRDALLDQDDSVDGKAIRETLSTGLFSSRGSGRMGWAHQSYGEFLGALYLCRSQMSTAQVLSLICHPGDPENRIVPQLADLAAWASSLDPDIFRELTSIEPQVLLRSNVTATDPSVTAELVENLLRFHREGRLTDGSLPALVGLTGFGLRRQLQ